MLLNCVTFSKVFAFSGAMFASLESGRKVPRLHKTENIMVKSLTPVCFSTQLQLKQGPYSVASLTPLIAVFVSEY